LKTCVAPSFFAISRRSARTSAGWLNSWPMNDVEKGGEREREREILINLGSTGDDDGSRSACLCREHAHQSDWA
jgi:hypothetical protein